MADDETTVDTQTGSDTDWEGEYKKLQRKLNRQQGKSRDETQRMAELEAGQRRTEQLLQVILEAASAGDETLQARARDAQRDFDSQRSSDTTAAQFEAELNQLLDSNETEWSDSRLDEARRLLDEVNRTGDLARLSEVRRLTQEALKDSGTSEDDIDSRIQDAILKDRQDHGRVDTGESVSKGQRYTREDVANLDPVALGVRGMREALNKVYDQMER
jgi:hypothetical protein